MKKLIMLGAAVALLLGGAAGEAVAQRAKSSGAPALLGELGSSAPRVAAGKDTKRSGGPRGTRHDDSGGGSELLQAQLVPASGGIATSVAEAQLTINDDGTVELQIQGLTGGSGPITNTGSLVIGLIVNGTGVPSPTFSVPVVNGNAEVTGTLPVAEGDVVEITGFRIFDSGGVADLLRAGGTIGGQGGQQFDVDGTISNLTGTCPNMTFTVDALAVTTDSNTQYENGSCSTLANGVKVEVEGVTQSGGTNLATQVQFEED